MTDVILARMIRHMKWANEKIFTQVSELPESALTFSAWNPEWTVGHICNHIVIAQGRFLSRLQKIDPPAENPFPLTQSGMNQLVAKSQENDAKFAKYLDDPDEMLTFVRYGETVSFLKSTLLAQVIHHATDHRSQIAAILAVNDMDVINLDAIDFWEFEKYERKNG
mgnify:FL=1